MSRNNSIHRYTLSILAAALVATLAGPALALGPKQVVPFKNRALCLLGKGKLQLSPAVRQAVIKLANNKRSDGWAKRGLQVFGRGGWTKGARVGLPEKPKANTWDLRYWRECHYDEPTPLSVFAKRLPNGNSLEVSVKKKYSDTERTKSGMLKVQTDYSFTVFGKRGGQLATGSSLKDLRGVNTQILGEGVPLRSLLRDVK